MVPLQTITPSSFPLFLHRNAIICNQKIFIFFLQIQQIQTQIQIQIQIQIQMHRNQSNTMICNKKILPSLECLLSCHCCRRRIFSSDRSSLHITMSLSQLWWQKHLFPNIHMLEGTHISMLDFHVWAVLTHLNCWDIFLPGVQSFNRNPPQNIQLTTVGRQCLFGSSCRPFLDYEECSCHWTLGYSKVIVSFPPAQVHIKRQI